MPRSRTAPRYGMFECPSCGYEAARKDHMEKHLYKKQQCPRRVNDIELTEEIKQYILVNRVYHVPKSATTVNNTFNNYYSHVTNIIASMDVLERIQTLVDNTHTQLIPLDTKIENLYGDAGTLLAIEDVSDLKDNALEKDDFYDMIERVARSSDDTFSDIGMLFDDKLNKLHIREGDAWSLERFDSGVKRIIGMLQDAYFDNYECYLIRRIVTDTNYRARQQCEELLRLYYGFIESFDLNPYVSSGDSSCDDVLSDEEHRERFEALYKREKESLKKVQRDRYIREVRDIIVRSARHNKGEISKCLLNLVKADAGFMQTMLNRTVTPT